MLSAKNRIKRIYRIYRTLYLFVVNIVYLKCCCNGPCFLRRCSHNAITIIGVGVRYCTSTRNKLPVASSTNFSLRTTRAVGVYYRILYEINGANLNGRNWFLWSVARSIVDPNPLIVGFGAGGVVFVA